MALLFLYLPVLIWGIEKIYWYFNGTHFLILLTQKQEKIQLEKRLNPVFSRWEGFAIL